MGNYLNYDKINISNYDCLTKKEKRITSFFQIYGEGAIFVLFATIAYFILKYKLIDKILLMIVGIPLFILTLYLVFHIIGKNYILKLLFEIFNDKYYVKKSKFYKEVAFGDNKVEDKFPQPSSQLFVFKSTEIFAFNIKCRQLLTHSHYLQINFNIILILDNSIKDEVIKPYLQRKMVNILYRVNSKNNNLNDMFIENMYLKEDINGILVRKSTIFVDRHLKIFFKPIIIKYSPTEYIGKKFHIKNDEIIFDFSEHLYKKTIKNLHSIIDKFGDGKSE